MAIRCVQFMKEYRIKIPITLTKEEFPALHSNKISVIGYDVQVIQLIRDVDVSTVFGQIKGAIVWRNWSLD